MDIAVLWRSRIREISAFSLVVTQDVLSLIVHHKRGEGTLSIGPLISCSAIRSLPTAI